jgi:branched-chain amino acid transport system ATP-binding protein
MTAGTDALLEIVNVSRHFGGLAAVDGVSTSVSKGEIRGVIGPNGAGKTTLFNLITGELKASSGRIFLKGEEITGLPPHMICRRGLGRTFQLTFVFPEMTVFDSVWVGVYGQAKEGSLFFSRAERLKGAKERTEEICALVGLRDKMKDLASNLTYGDQKVLEIAMALSTGPSLLLLDEPTQGVGPKEADAIVELVERLSKHMSILLIEHDMDLILRLCHNLTVLSFGRVIAEGTCDIIGSNEEVQRLYIGESV